MDKKITIKERIFAFLTKKGIKKTEFFESTGIQSANFKGKNMQSQLGGDMIVKILTTYPELSPEWLLIGTGEMLKRDASSAGTPSADAVISNDKGTKNIRVTQEKDVKSVPLVSQTVAAGFGNENFAIAEADVKDYYTIPRFRHTHVDFMIEVTGDSMTPHLNSGDIIARQPLHPVEQVPRHRHSRTGPPRQAPHARHRRKPPSRRLRQHTLPSLRHTQKRNHRARTRHRLRMPRVEHPPSFMGHPPDTP